jgi:hypothetical protein
VVNLLYFLLDGLGLSSNHGNKDMMFAVMKTIVKSLEILIKMDVDRADHTKKVKKFVVIIEAFNTQSQCQLTKEQYDYEDMFGDTRRLIELL